VWLHKSPDHDVFDQFIVAGKQFRPVNGFFDFSKFHVRKISPEFPQASKIVLKSQVTARLLWMWSIALCLTWDES
jgi:hypothetical protein